MESNKIIKDIEKSIICNLLLDEQALMYSLSELKTKDFVSTEAMAAFKLVKKQHNDKMKVDVLTLCSAANNDKLESYIKECSTFTMFSDNYVDHIKSLKSFTVKTEMKAMAQSMLVSEDSGELMLSKCLSNILTIAGKVDTQKIVNAEQIVKYGTDFLNKIEDTTGINTGFCRLDVTTCGLLNSNLYLLAARPAMGKSSLMLNIVTNMCRRGKYVLVFSLEMSLHDLTIRLLSSMTGMMFYKIQKKELTPQEREQIDKALKEIKSWNLFIDDSSGLTPFQMLYRAKNIKMLYNLDFIAVDYLQKMRVAFSHNKSRNDIVSEIAEGLGDMAKELKVPVLALSQLNRGVELRGDKRPVLSDLRDSGKLEEEAYSVFSLYRDEVYTGKNIGEAELNILKNRSGASNTVVKLNWNAEHMLFTDRF